MKTISTFILALLLLAGFKSQTDTTAKPEKIQGIDVYVMSEPSRPYEIIKTGGSTALLSCKEVINTPVSKAGVLPIPFLFNLWLCHCFGCGVSF